MKFVAELSANHLGSLERSIKLVEAAAQAGATHIKVQTFLPLSMVGNPDYVMEVGPWAGKKLVDLYREAWLPWEWHQPIFDRARQLGMTAFSTPFSAEAVDFLETLYCPMYKISSFEIPDLALIRYAAKTLKPLVLSTGMAMPTEIQDAVDVAREAGTQDLTLLKCTSGYPATASEANLATMLDMCDRYDVGVGVSDHTPGIGVAVAAAVFGADIIEKHFTLSRADGGLDSQFSMEPEEFALMVQTVKQATESIGKVDYTPSPSERSSLPLRRSLYFAKNLKSGQTITADVLKTARPALGLLPCMMDGLIGLPVNRDVKKGEPVQRDVVQMMH